MEVRNFMYVFMNIFYIQKGEKGKRRQHKEIIAARTEKLI